MKKVKMMSLRVKSDDEECKSDGEIDDQSKVEEVCIVCVMGEEDDSGVETWVLCDRCSNWIHEKCVRI